MTARIVQLTRAAARDLDSLEDAIRRVVLRDIALLAEEPVGPAPRIKRLRGFGGALYRLRCGNHRVLYRIEPTILLVMRVVDRRDLDRVLRRFDRS